MNYLITYDLNKPGQDYEGLYQAIRKYRNYHSLESVWFIKTTDSVTDILENLAPYIDKNDLIFICEITTNMTGRLHKQAWDFLKSN